MTNDTKPNPTGMTGKPRATELEMKRITRAMLELQDIGNEISDRYNVGFEIDECVIHQIQTAIMMLQQIDETHTEERNEKRKNAAKKAWETRRKGVQ